MTDENRFLSPVLAEWVAKFNSEASWVQGLNESYSLQVRESMAPAVGHASEVIARPVRMHFRQAGRQLSGQAMEPYVEAIRGVFSTISIGWVEAAGVAWNLTGAVDAGNIPEDVLKAVQQDFERLFPGLGGQMRQWGSWGARMALQVLLVLLYYIVFMIILGYVEESTGWVWLVDSAKSLLNKYDPTQGLSETWNSRPGRSDSQSEDEGEGRG